MKTIIIIISLGVIGITALFTNVEQIMFTLKENTNTLIHLEHYLDIAKYQEDAIHYDNVCIKGNPWCEDSNSLHNNQLSKK